MLIIEKKIELFYKALADQELIILEYHEELLASRVQNQMIFAQLAKYKKMVTRFASSRDVTILSTEGSDGKCFSPWRCE